jgi:hypothetical protein
LGSGEAYKRFGCANLTERDHFEDLGIDGRIILKLFLRKSVRRVWTEVIWFRRGTIGRLL